MEFTIWHYVAAVLLGVSANAAIDRFMVLWHGTQPTRRQRIVAVVDMVVTLAFVIVFLASVL